MPLKFFACSLVAFKDPTTVRHFALAVRAATEGNARVQAADKLLTLMPPAEGFTNHDVEVLEIPTSWFTGG